METSDNETPYSEANENEELEVQTESFFDEKNAEHIPQSNVWKSFVQTETDEPQKTTSTQSSIEISNMTTASHSNTLPSTNSSTIHHGHTNTQPVDMKKVLADRLRKRIEERDAGVSSGGFAETQYTNGIKTEEKFDSLQSQEELNDLDYVEGFQIYADDAPTDISKLPTGHYTQYDSPSVQRPIRKKTPSVKIAENYFTFNPLAPGVSPPKPKESPTISNNNVSTVPVPPVHTVSKTTHTNYFGPHVIKRALKAMDNRATAVAITDWIVDNLPQYLHYFGDKKKLRYSVVGILSAKAYANIFQKEVVVERGVRRSDWILTDPNAADDDANFLPMAAVANFNPAPDTSGVTDISANASLGSAMEGIEGPSEKTEVSAAPVPDPYERKDCSICGQGTDDNKLLLCDSCDQGYHIYCLQPPLRTIPRGAWYCSSCIAHGNAPSLAEQLSEDESAFDHPGGGEDDLDRDTEEEQDGMPRACEKHRKWKKRCPPDCMMRPPKPLGKNEKYEIEMQPSLMPIPRYKKKGQSKRKNRDNEGYRRSKKARGGKDGEAPTYIDMVEEAIKALGGQATTPDITNFMETHYGNLLATKTKTWRNSVSGCLSTHFARIKSKEGDGRAIWTLAFPADEPESDLDIQQEEDDYYDEMEIVELHSEPSPTVPVYKTRSSSREPKYKAPKRRSHVVFEPFRLDELKAENPDDYDVENLPPISFINKHHPLDLIKTNLSHPGGVMRLVWSTDLTKLASVSTLGTIRIWNIEDWSLIKELKDKDEPNIEEFFALQWSPDDTKLIVAGKHKDRKKWDPEEEDFTSQAAAIKIFDIESGKVSLKLEGHTSDVLDIKLIHYCRQLFLVSAGADGTVRKWLLDDNLTTLIGSSILADYGSKLAVSIQFVPGTGKKFFFVSCDTGLKLFDFETEQLVQDFPGIYTYLCDSIQFTKWLDAPPSKTEEQVLGQYPPQYLLIKGVELLDQHDKVVRANSCQLYRFEFPEAGKGKFRLELVSSFSHEWYNSNIWQTRLTSNGRYALSPTTEGKVFVWNLKSKEVVAILHDHGNREVRDILFHPKQRLMVTSADDSMLRVYSQKEIIGAPIVSPTMPTMVPQSEQEQNAEPSSILQAEPAVVRIKTNEEEHVDIDSDNQSAKDSSPPLRKSVRPRQLTTLLAEEMETDFLKTTPRVSPANSPNFLASEIGTSPGSSSEKKRRGLPGACEQHKRDHVKCPPECPGRALQSSQQ